MNLTYDRIRDKYLITDPGLFRLRGALRGTVTVVLASFALWLISDYSHRSFLLALVGAMVAMNGALTTDEPLVRDQKVTAILLPIFSAVSTVVGGLVLPYPPIAIAGLLIFTFFGIEARRHGQRWNILGGISYVSYFAALFFKVPPDQIVWVLLGIGICGVLWFIIKFYIVPDRAQSAIAWSLSAYRASLRRFVRAARRELQSSITMRMDREILRSRIVKINELAFLSEDAILNAADAIPGSAALVRALQGRVFDLELSARRIFETLDQRPREDIARDLDQLEATYNTLKSNEAALVEEEKSVAPRERKLTPLHKGLHFQTRQAIQATLATAIATVVGTMISTDRWYWAPLTAYVVFTGTTRGDSLRRAFSRLFGTACGVAAGLTIAYLLSADRNWELAVLFFAMFCAIFAIKTSYAWYVFWLTTLIAIFYNLLGLLTPGLLYLRIEQTIIGGLCGGLCAFFVLPVSSKQTLRGEMARLFQLLSDHLNDTVDSSLPRRERRLRVRALERELATLRSLAGPLRGPFGRPVREETRIIVHGASVLVYYARMLIVFFPHNEVAMRGSVSQLAIRAQALANRVTSVNFVDIADPMTGGAHGETWSEENPLDQEVATYSLQRLAQSISAFETRFPAQS